MLPLAVGMPVALTDHIDRNPEKQLLRGKVWVSASTARQKRWRIAGEELWWLTRRRNAAIRLLQEAADAAARDGRSQHKGLFLSQMGTSAVASMPHVVS